MLDWQEMAQELSGGAEIKEGGDAAEALESLSAEIERLTELLEETETNLLLSSEEDHADAILEIHPGAGGTEAQDWAQMLQRMYLRWADSHGFSVEELDFLPGDEAGIKSVSLRISGENVYGLSLIHILPVTSSTSACLGSPMFTMPKRSTSKTGVRQASTSMSHPLQEPQS